MLANDQAIICLIISDQYAGKEGRAGVCARCHMLLLLLPLRLLHVTKSNEMMTVGTGGLKGGEESCSLKLKGGGGEAES